MKKIILASIIISTGCTSMTGYQPTVDAYNDKNKAYIESDTQECKALADQASGGVFKQSGIGMGLGALAGAAAGAVAGAMAGDPATGAMIGGASGGLGGAGWQGYESDIKYKRAFDECMYGRGHRVLR